MSSGPDVERLLEKLHIASFPYREFGAEAHSPDQPSSEDGERWLNSLAILRREWERASATHRQAVLDRDDAGAAELAPEPVPRPETAAPARAPSSAEPIFPNRGRPQLQQLFQRGKTGASQKDNTLADLFSRLS